MTRFKFILVIIGLAILSGFIAHSSDWYKYQDNDCEVLFPAPPTADTIVKDVSSIGKIYFYRHILKNTENESNITYEFLKIEYPPDELVNPTKDVIESFFKGIVEESLSKTHGKLLSEKDISLSGYPGKEVKINFDNGTKMITMKTYLVKSKNYTLEAVALAGKETNSTATKFFDSFKIK